jgi:hypothetical protein
MPRAAPIQEASAVPSAASSLFERLRSGAIDLNGYLDAKVDEATEHLHGLSAPELQAIRSALRDRLAHDPTLVDLVQRVAEGGADAEAGLAATPRGED